MKRIIGILCVMLVSGCANFLSTTANRGISYGMPPEAVIKVNEKKGYTVISQNESTVVVKGMQEQLKQPSLKTFIFENGQLVSVSEKME